MDIFDKKAMMFYQFRLGEIIKPLADALEKAAKNDDPDITLSVIDGNAVIKELKALHEVNKRKIGKTIDPKEMWVIRTEYDQIMTGKTHD